MGDPSSPFAEEFLDAAIRRLVAEAAENQSTISTAECIAAVMRFYPACGLSEREISDKVIAAASAAGIAVEFGTTRKLPD